MTNPRSGRTGAQGMPRGVGTKPVSYDPHSVDGRATIESAVVGVLVAEHGRPLRVASVVGRLPGMPYAAAQAALRRMALREDPPVVAQGERGQRKYLARAVTK